MFRKLLSNLPFNPSLIGKVTFYTKRLRKESAVRRMGVFFIVASLGIQIFAVLAPAQPSLASSANDIHSGFTSQTDMVNTCRNNFEFATILRHFGVSCDAVSQGYVGSVSSRDYGGQLFSLGRIAYGKTGETPVDIAGAGRYYMRYLWSWDGASPSYYQALKGTRADGTPFMILFSCGNIVIVGPPPTQPAPKVISCSNLFMNVPQSSRVALNSKVKVWGQASGANLPPGELVDMNYDFVTDKGQPLGTAQARGIPFVGGFATDPVQREFTASQPGHFFFRVFIKYDGGAKDGIASFACLKDVYVDTPPPQPEKQIACTTLISSFSDGQRIVTGTSVNVRGQASGRNLAPVEYADMYYDYINETGQVQGSQKALGVPFKDGSAQDTTPRSFKLEKPGTYTFRLLVKYDSSSKTASGSQTGNCLKKVVVQPPCEESKKNDVTECIILNKRASNLTQNIPDANNTLAHAGDIILYTLSATNTSKTTTLKGFVFSEDLNDVLEYADITDLHGGIMGDHNVIHWAPVDIKPGQKVEKQITVRVKNPIPQTPVSGSNPASFDMLMTNVYGDTVNIKLPPSTSKRTEMTTTTLPNTGPGETIALGFAVVLVAGYFFARNRLMVKELGLVRSDYSVSGGL